VERGCPHCGEAEPHLTEREEEERKEKIKADAEKAAAEEERKKAESKLESKLGKVGCLIIIVVFFILVFISMHRDYKLEEKRSREINSAPPLS